MLEEYSQTREKHADITERSSTSFAGSNFHIDLAVERKNNKRGDFLSLNATVSAIICRLKFDWFVSVSEGYLDVTPVLKTFENVRYDAYHVGTKLFKVKPDNDGIYDLSKVADLLVDDFLSQQSISINRLSNIGGNEKTDFAVGIFRDIRNVAMILLNDENTKMIFEFPLLSSESNQNSDSEYLYDVTESDPIIVNVELTIIRNTFTVMYKVMIPKSMPCSKNIDFPKNSNKNLTDDNELIDLIPSIESKILKSWRSRKLFIEELKQISAVLEYDAIDFSYVSIVLRMKYNNMYTICTIEFRISHFFPAAIPLMSLHDLQNAFSTPIDTSSVKVTKNNSPVRLARELLLLCGTVISQQAFHTDIFET